MWKRTAQAWFWYKRGKMGRGLFFFIGFLIESECCLSIQRRETMYWIINILIFSLLGRLQRAKIFSFLFFWWVLKFPSSFAPYYFARLSKLSCCSFLQCDSYSCYNLTPSYFNLWKRNCILSHICPHTSHLQQCLYYPTTSAKPYITGLLKQYLKVNIYPHHRRYNILY